MKRNLAVAFLAASLATAAPAQSVLRIKACLVSNEMEPSSHELGQTLRQKMNMIKTFRFADKKPPELILNVDCIPRAVSEPYTCMYVALYVGPSFKTFLGAAVCTDKSADTMAGLSPVVYR